MRNGYESLRQRAGALPIRAFVATGALILAIGGAGPAGAAPPDAIATTDAFVNAIGRGDRATVRDLLLPNVVIFESGGAERSADEYATRHLQADIQFMAGMKREVKSQESGGDQATRWVATTARVRGIHKEKAVDVDSTETFILTRTAAGWRIAHVHWSSSSHRPASPAHS
jgi:ketosteroid isomerase-like protein